MQSLILGLAWSGICMFIDFTMWHGNIFAWWYEWLDKSKWGITKAFGLCKICFCFWFGILFYHFNSHYGDSYFVFLGASQLIIIFYHTICLHLNK